MQKKNLEIRAYMCGDENSDELIGQRIIDRAHEFGVAATLSKPERLTSTFTADALRTVTESLRREIPIPKVRYVLINAAESQKKIFCRSAIFQIQERKHGWSVKHVDGNCSNEILERRIDELFEIKTSTERINVMKKNEAKEIYTTLKNTESKELSLRENMINYCVNVEHYSAEDAAKTVDGIIKGTSEFMNAFEGIKNLPKDEAILSIKDRLADRIKDLSEEDANKILENIFVELKALSCDRLEMIASVANDENLKAEIKRIREECKVTLQDKSMDEKLTLIVEAAANCGSMSALIALMQDKKSFSGAETMDDAVSNATLDSTENEYVSEEYESFHNRSYAALGEYISAQHGNNRKFTAEASPYDVGVYTAMTVEQTRIRNAAAHGMITLDNALKLLGAVAVVGIAIGFSMIVMGSAAITVPALMAMGATPLVFAVNALQIALFGYLVIQMFKHNKKLGEYLAAPAIWVKNLLVTLFRKFCHLFGIKTKAEETTVGVEDDAVEVEEATEEEVNTSSETNSETVTAAEEVCDPA
ncbi:MAG: sulfite exporter TauE/SafE family protein [Clostridia bacterium]|nr:sulfite exporter TauE/SafE family protein [Clostridia bacterium]